MSKKYVETLSKIARDRYLQKLLCVCNRVGDSSEDCVDRLDPYQFAADQWIDDISRWPPVEYPDLYSYLIETPGEFSKEKLKAFKSLEAYNYYKSGWVHTIYYHDLGSDYKNCILKSKVNPSQRLSEKPHEPWVAVEKTSGCIVTAHCTCMAGLGEVCSHVAAVLFKVEACIRLGVSSLTCTSLPCVWNQAFSKKIQPAPIQSINFAQPKRDNEATVTLECSESTVHGPTTTKQAKSLAPPVDQQALLTTLYKVHPSAAVFSVVPGFPQTKPSSQVEDEPNLPPLLTSLYDSKYLDLSEDELSEVSQCRLNDIQFTKEEAAFLEKSTKQQSNSSLWYDHRKGRITASVFGRVARCAERTYPTSLIKNIMQYTSISPSIPALNWGRKNEHRARVEYINTIKNQHRNFSVAKSGLCLHSEYPHLGATPDGFVSCDCCGEGLVEIKCPYKYRDVVLSSINDNSFYLKTDRDGKLCLINSHDYYYQVQGQMAVCEKPYCDFVCWTTKDIYVERIKRDDKFYKAISPKLEKIFIHYVLPELLTRQLEGARNTDKTTELDKFCLCNQEEFGTMIACDGPNCKITWFHFSCVGLHSEPEGDWFCDQCNKL